MATHDQEQPAEPRIAYINDIMIDLDRAFPNSDKDEMPPDTFDDLPEPEDKPTKGN